MTIAPIKLEEVVMKYYHLVDNQNYQPMLDLFTDDAVYRRCSQIIDGKESLRKFYYGERDLRGIHLLKTSLGNEDLVVIEGIFQGTKNGEPFKVRFSDFFWFNEEGKIRERHTYTDQGKV